MCNSKYHNKTYNFFLCLILGGGSLPGYHTNPSWKDQTGQRSNQRIKNKFDNNFCCSLQHQRLLCRSTGRQLVKKYYKNPLKNAFKIKLIPIFKRFVATPFTVVIKSGETMTTGKSSSPPAQLGISLASRRKNVYRE